MDQVDDQVQGAVVNIPGMEFESGHQSRADQSCVMGRSI
jgi:hypothetical protein